MKIPNSEGTGMYEPVHNVTAGTLIREGRRWCRVTRVYANGWDTELVPLREQFGAWLRRKPLA